MRVWAAGLWFCGVVVPALAQSRLSGVGETVHLVNTDLAVLESQIPRKDLPCVVKPTETTLGFDLRFHTGYDVTIPLKELAGDDSQPRGR